MKKTVVVGVTSSIAAYKTLELIKLLKKDGIDVRVIMTKSAEAMVAPGKFEKVSENKVLADLFPKGFDYEQTLKKRRVEHIDLADNADLILIVPTTANLLAKLANGFADDYLTTTVLAATSPIVIAPAMNVNMWNNPAVQKNVQVLKQRGYQIIEPTSGMLACGYEGRGRLEDVQMIYEEAVKILNRTDSLKRKRILVTAGGTIEKIDDVRYITNRSSGKMGVAIAEECFLRGAKVTLFRAKNAVTPRYLLTEQTFSTADDLSKLISENINNFDVIFHVAAVSDFKVENGLKGKLSGNKKVQLTLSPKKKIINGIKKINPKVKLISFKAEHGIDEKKLVKLLDLSFKESGSDAIVANDVDRSDRGFESDDNEVFIVTPNGNIKKIPLGSKVNIAKKIADFLEELIAKK